MDWGAARSVSPLTKGRRLEASKTDARGLFCCFFDVETRSISEIGEARSS